MRSCDEEDASDSQGDMPCIEKVPEWQYVLLITQFNQQ